jgi:hypothetical protein
MEDFHLMDDPLNERSSFDGERTSLSFRASPLTGPLNLSTTDAKLPRRPRFVEPRAVGV